MNINIKLLNENAKIPTQGSVNSAGYDLYAIIDTPSGVLTIMPHENALIGTGIALEIPEGYFGGIFARSGLAHKKGLRPSNCVGVIDSDYRGEIMVSLRNDTEELMGVTNGERIGQLVVMPFLQLCFELVEQVEDTERGDGGFGSTGEH